MEIDVQTFVIKKEIEMQKEFYMSACDKYGDFSTESLIYEARLDGMLSIARILGIEF